MRSGSISDDELIVPAEEPSRCNAEEEEEEGLEVPPAEKD
jgi:hypothetical protein